MFETACSFEMYEAVSANQGCCGEHLWEGQLQSSYGFAIFFCLDILTNNTACVHLHPQCILILKLASTYLTKTLIVNPEIGYVS